MTEAEVRHVAGEKAFPETWRRVQGLEAKGYRPHVFLDARGKVVIEVSVVLSNDEPAEAETALCALCGGAGEMSAIVVKRAGDVTFTDREILLCAWCEGEGQVTGEKAERLEAGRLMREDRVRRGVSLEAEARERGLTVPELTRQEWGR